MGIGGVRGLGGSVGYILVAPVRPGATGCRARRAAYHGRPLTEPTRPEPTVRRRGQPTETTA